MDFLVRIRNVVKGDGDDGMVLKRSRCMPDTVIKQVLGNGKKRHGWCLSS